MTSKIASKYGAFSDVGFLSSGEPYNDKDPLRHGNSRYKGLNMKATRCKTGKTNDAAFDRLKPLYEKEKCAGVMTLEERAPRARRARLGASTPPETPQQTPHPNQRPRLVRRLHRTQVRARAADGGRDAKG